MRFQWENEGKYFGEGVHLGIVGENGIIALKKQKHSNYILFNPSSGVILET